MAPLLIASIISFYLSAAARSEGKLKDANHEKLHYSVVIDRDHNLFRFDKSGRVSSAPFVFDPDNFVYRVSSRGLAPSPCDIEIEYVFDEDVNLVLKGPKSRASDSLAFGDLIRYFKKGPFELMRAAYGKATAPKDCEALQAKLGSRGVGRILKTARASKMPTGSFDSAINEDYELIWSFGRFNFRQLTLESLRRLLQFSQCPTSQAISRFLRRELDKPMFPASNAAEVKPLASHWAKSYQLWLARLRRLCREHDLLQGTPGRTGRARGPE